MAVKLTTEIKLGSLIHQLGKYMISYLRSEGVFLTYDNKAGFILSYLVIATYQMLMVDTKFQ